MKVVLCILTLLFGSNAWAGDSTDRVAIGRVIAALNERRLRTDLFTADSVSMSEVEQFWKDKRLSFGGRTQPSGLESSAPGDSPTVTISHEPWGEATINVPPPILELVNPRIVSGVVNFITNDVALAEGACLYDVAGGMQTTPLLFIMKREGDRWKIAAIRLLAQP